ncbi:MAG: hypothetical protein HFJ57_01095 [Clostridia bacterium]|nr:hypothetical protein [Clostridia bacterium]
MKNKSKLVIAISVIVVIVIAIVIGLLLYLKTDIFKSNQELFFRYALQNGEILEDFVIYSQNEVLDNIKKSEHTTDTNFNFQLVSNDPQIANQTIPARNFSMNYSKKADPVNNKASSETTINFLTRELFKLKYIQDGNLYALKSDEVVNKYLAFNNSNLKGLAKKFELEDISKIPNQIEKVDFKELLKLTDEEKEYLYTKYINVINKNVSKEKYKKQTNVTININDRDIITNAYTLELTKQEWTNLIISILQETLQDNQTLNILLQKVTLINKDISLDSLETILQNEITRLGQTSKMGSVKVLVYEKDKQLVKTVIVDDNNEGIGITYLKNNNAIKAVLDFNYTYVEEPEPEPEAPVDDGYAVIQDPNANQNQNEQKTEAWEAKEILKNLMPKIDKSIIIKDIEIEKQINDGQYESTYILTYTKGDETVKVAMTDTTTNNITNGEVDSNIVININNNDTTYFTVNAKTITKQTTGLVIESLVRENSATVNDFTPKYIATLTQQIVNRLKQLYNQKLEIVHTVQQEEQVPQTPTPEQTTTITQGNGNGQNNTNQITNTNNTIGTQNNV